MDGVSINNSQIKLTKRKFLRKIINKTKEEKEDLNKLFEDTSEYFYIPDFNKPDKMVVGNLKNKK